MAHTALIEWGASRVEAEVPAKPSRRALHDRIGIASDAAVDTHAMRIQLLSKSLFVVKLLPPTRATKAARPSAAPIWRKDTTVRQAQHNGSTPRGNRRRESMKRALLALAVGGAASLVAASGASADPANSAQAHLFKATCTGLAT